MDSSVYHKNIESPSIRRLPDDLFLECPSSTSNIEVKVSFIARESIW